MAEQNKLDAQVAEVTVFRDGARVVRRGTVTLEAGTRTVVLPTLASTVDPASVRVVARGAGMALRDVEVHRDFRVAPLRVDTAQLRADVERCREALQALEDEDATEQARLGFLGHLSEAAATSFARAVSFGRAEHGEFARMADELAGGTGAALARRREISGRRRAAERELEAAAERLATGEAGPPRPVEIVEVRATLEVKGRVEAALEVSYHVSGASWQPLYDLRLDGERLAVSYLAEVTQRSGEDWPPVELALSTTRRGRHRSVPELRPWFIGRLIPVPPGMSAHAVRRAHAPGVAAAATPEPLSAGPQSPRFEAEHIPEAPPLVTHPEESGAALVYRVPTLMPVPSDGAPHKTTVARFELDAALDHLTIPKLAPEAYLRATVTNSSPLLLLPGPASVFHDVEYVGATDLGTVAPGEEFELHLGVDDRIRVERLLRRKSTGKAVIGGTRSVEVAYEITVENHRDKPVRITVQDQIPTSRDGEVKVKLRESSPKAVEQEDLGQLTWKLGLEPGGKSAIRLAFTVEHPASVVLTGL
jgi:uncharacterized protein (TIGR02231 family)